MKRIHRKCADVGPELLDDVWVPGFVDTNTAGGFSAKQQQLAKVARSRVKIVSLKVDQERTGLYGNTAVVTERFHKPGGKRARIRAAQPTSG